MFFPEVDFIQKLKKFFKFIYRMIIFLQESDNISLDKLAKLLELKRGVDFQFKTDLLCHRTIEEFLIVWTEYE